MATLPLDWNAQLATSNPLFARPLPLVTKVVRRLGIQGSFFCGQECFKAGCEKPIKSSTVLSSKILRRSTRMERTIRFPTITSRDLCDLSIHSLQNARSEIRAQGQPPRILSAEEIEKMRTVCRMSREILDIAAAAVRPGITTDEIDEIVHNATIERNAYPSPLNYREFPKSVCTSINEVICHGIPDKRKLKEGDIINLDVSVYYQGYHGDVNGTYPVGNIDDESAKLIRTSRECLDKSIEMCKPGALFRDVGKTIEPIARSNGCSSVRTYTGHGINTLFHTAPNIPHYAKNKAIGTMKAGMVFTIEPMINLGSNWGDVHWPDNWTATTTDGKRSAQFEETLLITETGVEVLTAGTKQVA
ncbi:peptidase M24, structural domain-containing protein [Mycena metata]|uniref:Methionine aminopeptidase n=1 Tax=Mycena metata TaxID=1033252 RepID=A0AAD7K310_9AGAR|nr:peptidase M24, structural domain-containing protein [Mycena metata]